MARKTIQRLIEEAGIPAEQSQDIIQKARDVMRVRSMRHTVAATLITTAVVVFPMMPWLVILVSSTGTALYVAMIGAPITALILIAIDVKLITRYRSGRLKNLVQRILARWGQRFCHNCNYDLQGLAPNTEWCPECGVYIAGPTTSDDTSPRPVYFNRDPDDVVRARHVIFKGIDLEPAVVNKALIESQSRLNRASDKAFAWIVTIVLIASMIGLNLFMRRYSIGGFKKVLPYAIPGIALVSWVVFLAKRNAGRLRDEMRQCLRRDGIDLCVQCGQFLGDIEAGTAGCPECGAPRESMPG